MTYCFRLRFRVGRVRIESTDTVLALTDPDTHPEIVRLAAADTDQPLNATQEYQVTGRSYATEEAASLAAKRWQGVIEKTFARNKIGADFGRTAPTQWLSPELLAQHEAEQGTTVIQDRLGATVFEGEPEPRFLKWTLEDYRGRYPAHLQVVAAAADKRDITMSAPERLAFELFSASFWPSLYPDARFMLMMMALETLIEPGSRSDEAVAHVDELIHATQESGLAKQDVDSLVISLRHLRTESIGRAGKRLVERLGGRRYMDHTPKQFFQSCYDFRSRLVHGGTDRPSRDDVEGYSVELEVLLMDLLSFELLDVEAPGLPKR